MSRVPEGFFPRRVCDSCDEVIQNDEKTVSYPLAFATIDFHERCAEREPRRGFTMEMARKASNRSVENTKPAK